MKNRVLFVVLIFTGLSVGYSQNAWQATTLPSDVFAVGMAVSGKDTSSIIHGPGAMYAGTELGSVFLHPDRIDEWFPGAGGFPVIQSIASDTVNGVTYLGTYNGLYRTMNGGRSWEKIAFAGYEIWDLEVNQSTGVVYAVLYRETSFIDDNIGIHFSSNRGGSWNKVFTGVVCKDVFVNEDNSLLAATGNGVIIFTPGQGNGLGRPADVLYSVAGLPNGVVLTGTRQGLFRKEPAGGFVNVLSVSAISGWVYCLYVSKAGVIYAGTSGSAVYRSVDGGLTWHSFSTGMSQYAEIHKFGVNRSGKLFAAGGMVYELTDPAEPPSMVRLLSPSNDTTGVVEDLRLDWDTAYTTGHYTLQIAADSLFQNKIVNDSLLTESKYTIQMVQLQSNATYYWRVSAENVAGRGKWSLVRRFSTGVLVGIHENRGTVPAEFRLNQNYPNPFNPETVIRFSLPSTGYARGAVYDILGREVAIMIDGETVAGNYELKFNAEGLPSGVYIFKLELGNRSAAIKMVVNR